MENKLAVKNNYYKSVNIEAPLEKEEEFALIKKWQKYSDKKSLNRIIGAYKRLVNSTARKYLSYGLPKDDLMHEGVLGIIIALKKFDISRGFRLSTYARWWIRASIQNYILKNWSIVKSSSNASHKALFFNLNKLKKQIDFKSFDYMGSEEINKISEILKIKSFEIQNMESKLAMGDQSLNQNISDENNKIDLLSLLKDDSPTQDIIFEKNNDNKLKNAWLTKALDQLKDREKMIILNRKLEEKAKTFEELGKKLKLSKERVRQIEVEALKKLKASILEISKQPKNFFIN
tara:strand:+ start:129 stop:998 length:870 start_codon:yes stop_codon:yes gene_type:complete